MPIMFFGDSIYQLLQNLQANKDLKAITNTLHAFFLARFPAHNKFHFTGEQIVRFVLSHLDEPFDQLAKKAGYSSKHLIHLFRSYTGFTPKALQQVMQFTSSIQQISILPTQHLTGFAHHTNYFDQSHFIKQFKRFSGFTPRAYLNTGNSCPRMVLLNKKY